MLVLFYFAISLSLTDPTLFCVIHFFMYTLLCLLFCCILILNWNCTRSFVLLCHYGVHVHSRASTNSQLFLSALKHKRTHVRGNTHTYTQKQCTRARLALEFEIIRFLFFSMFTRTVAAAKEAGGKNTTLIFLFTCYIFNLTFIHTINHTHFSFYT